jgi:hypothetical protein
MLGFVMHFDGVEKPVTGRVSITVTESLKALGINVAPALQPSPSDGLRDSAVSRLEVVSDATHEVYRLAGP